jgi:hypothetical protein
LIAGKAAISLAVTLGGAVAAAAVATTGPFSDAAAV